jgi:hypothetical protein
MEQQTLTIKEAFEQGYLYFGYADREWQTLNDIDAEIFDDEDLIDELDNLRLFDKEPKTHTIDVTTVASLLADHISDAADEECYREDNDIHDTVTSLDFTETTNQINKALENKIWYILTDIQLIR